MQMHLERGKTPEHVRMSGQMKGPVGTISGTEDCQLYGLTSYRQQRSNK